MTVSNDPNQYFVLLPICSERGILVDESQNSNIVGDAHGRNGTIAAIPEFS